MPSPHERLMRRGGSWMWCVKTVKWFPVIFIVSVILWSYYAYVIQLCLLTVVSNIQRVVYIVLYHAFLLFFLWSYYQTIFNSIGKVPSQFRLPASELDRLMQAESDEAKIQVVKRFAQNLPISNRTASGAVRFCEICQHVKPDRAHHCSVCGDCVLKMDHHCPWVNNCVSFTNYKFFTLFLGYAFSYCMFIALTTLQFFIKFWKNELNGMEHFHILLLFFVSIMFALSLVSLFGYHLYLVVHNRTTLESFRPPVFQTGPDKNGFSLGKFNNFQEVFGDNKNLWLLPVYSSLGDGVTFPVRAQHQSNLYNSMGSTHNSLGDGVTFPQRCIDEDTDSLLGGCQRWDDNEAGCQRWLESEATSHHHVQQDDSDSSSAVPDIVIMN
ncbi:palmitoyltransferase ZDHHC20-B isoform X1 [Frankliniella occidentalis]|uniref:Palmitoyltransferase n=1 Tax=Frankliniella occidentalis TaxID=133901 RepID=A0A9C6WUS6_FRAOC|nr:palmitoyltransferase ZDHHC20-B isoform X1 [Frankliniella occidentalis]